ncbi:hypothetical protein RFI_07397 [Reticulomyxa filosa]|uniref:Uncharacterized protein n=1 Tax=Reticulomyxa filosa TaxID=46433 RepID=X6NUL7_RETFI|nr:hypothetical protein RFI_07397 [Reticulomyxa filosa]|eukprot:ETO29721.1 hypothetical protein RFI_07397 [Reticulomyxa filosa]
MSSEFKQWCRIKIEKMNKEVDAEVVIQMLCSISEEQSIRDNIYDVFGNNHDSVQFVDTFLLTRKSERQNAQKASGQHQGVTFLFLSFLLQENTKNPKEKIKFFPSNWKGLFPAK